MSSRENLSITLCNNKQGNNIGWWASRSVLNLTLQNNVEVKSDREERSSAGPLVTDYGN